MANEKKTFWKAVKPLFSNKVQSSFSIILLENSIVESTESKVAEVFNKYLNDHMGDTLQKFLLNI